MYEAQKRLARSFVLGLAAGQGSNESAKRFIPFEIFIQRERDETEAFWMGDTSARLQLLKFLPLCSCLYRNYYLISKTAVFDIPSLHFLTYTVSLS